jgi:hypothetical protein
MFCGDGAQIPGPCPGSNAAIARLQNALYLLEALNLSNIVHIKVFNFFNKFFLATLFLPVAGISAPACHAMPRHPWAGHM